MEALLDYKFAEKILAKQGIYATPSDIYGLMLGIIAGGIKQKDKEFKTTLLQCLDDIESFDETIEDWVNQQAKRITNEFIDAEGIKLLLPDETASLEEQAVAVVALANGFVEGFSQKQRSLDALSQEVKEFVQDLLEISNLDISETLNAAVQESAMSDDLIVLEEHISVGAQICFEECASKDYPKDKPFVVEDDGELTQLSEEREKIHNQEASFWEKQSKLKR